MALRLAFAPVFLVVALVSAGPLAGANGSGDVEPYGLAHGRLHLTSSRQGAVLSGRELVPGDRVRGALTILNTGTLAGSFTLSGFTHGNTRLARHLALSVRETSRGAASLVYAGSLAGLRAVKLGVIGPGEARHFRFAVTFRSTGSNAADAAFGGRRTHADFTWTAVQAS